MNEDNRHRPGEARQTDNARHVNSNMDPPKRDHNDQHIDNAAPTLKRRINMIMDGLQSCNNSVRSIKEYEWKAITSQKWQRTTNNDASLISWKPIPTGWLNLKITLW